MIIGKKYIILAAVILAVAATVAVLLLSGGKKQPVMADGVKIVLDAGHGYPDGGAVGSDGTQEKDINLAITEKLREVLEGRGYVVVMTRDGDSGLQDESAGTIREMKKSDMNKRREIVEKSGADLFLSIHMNSFSDPKVSGLHIFYDKAHPEAETLAKSIQQKIGEVTGAETHTVKTADNSLFLMKNSPIPAILAECGFLSNPEEISKLKDEAYQAKIAWAIAEAIGEYNK